MFCKICGLELRVKRRLAESATLVLACRNKQCPDYDREQKITEQELLARQKPG